MAVVTDETEAENGVYEGTGSILWAATDIRSPKPWARRWYRMMAHKRC